MAIILLTASDVRKVLPMGETIEAMKTAFAVLSDGRVEIPLRSRLPVAPHNGVSLFMPAYVQYEDGEVLTLKVVSVFPHNTHRKLPTIHAAVLVLEAETGRPLALLEGGVLTAIRTGAASGAATDLLANPHSSVAVIFGAGVQGRTQLEAVCTVRPIRRAWIYDRNPQKIRTFIDEMAGKGPIPTDLRTAESPQQAVAEADVICTATTSPTPVFSDSDLKPGVHINGVGSYTPEMQEIPAESIVRALVVVDSRPAALAETGDLIQPIQRGMFSADLIHAELGEIVLGRKPGRTTEEQVTIFKSVGVAVQDALAARMALSNALKFNVGQRVEF